MNMKEQVSLTLWIGNADNFRNCNAIKTPYLEVG